MTRLFHVDISCHRFLSITLSVSVARPQHMLYIHKKKTHSLTLPPPLFLFSFFLHIRMLQKQMAYLSCWAGPSKPCVFLSLQSRSLVASRKSGRCWPARWIAPSHSVCLEKQNKQKLPYHRPLTKESKYAPNCFRGMLCPCTSWGSPRGVAVVGTLSKFLFLQRFFTHPKFFRRLVLLAERPKKRLKKKYSNCVASIGLLLALIIAEHFFFSSNADVASAANKFLTGVRRSALPLAWAHGSDKACVYFLKALHAAAEAFLFF